MKINFKTKVRFYTFVSLLVATILTTVYLNFIKTDDSTTVDHHYAKNAELIVDQLKMTQWGKTSRGKKILSAFHIEEVRIITPFKVTVNGNDHYAYRHDIIGSASSGAMVKEHGQYQILIGVYHIKDLSSSEKRLIRYMDYAIPEDEFIHILVDELTSRRLEGMYFVDGEASQEEELDAWRASEEAVKAYYGDPSYQIKEFSHSCPKYGPSNEKYQEIQ